MERIVIAISFVLACGSDPMPPRLADLGLSCDASHPCPSGTECGTCGIGTGQCVASCEASGSAGCPAGSFCSAAWSGGVTTHLCVRTCTADLDCQTPTGNQGLSCNQPYLDPGTSANDVSICNVSNSIGSMHTCP